METGRQDAIAQSQPEDAQSPRAIDAQDIGTRHDLQLKPTNMGRSHMSEEDHAAEHNVILRAVDSISKPYPILEAGESAEEFINIIAALRSRKINRYRSVMDLFLRRNGQPALVFRELHVNKYPEPTSLRGHSRIEIIGLHLGRDSPQTRRGPKLPREFINALRSEMAQYLRTQFVDMKMVKASYPSKIEVIFRTESAANLFVAAFCKDTRSAQLFNEH